MLRPAAEVLQSLERNSPAGSSCACAKFGSPILWSSNATRQQKLAGMICMGVRESQYPPDQHSCTLQYQADLKAAVPHAEVGSRTTICCCFGTHRSIEAD